MPGLFGSTILDVALGMVFIYLLLSLITSSINELLAGFLKLRARDLTRGIANLLCDPETATRVLRHPLIKAMGSTRAETPIVQFAAGGDVGAVATGIRRFFARLGRYFKGARSYLAARTDFAGTPSYVPARTFANALLDALDPDRPGTIQVDVVEKKTRDLADGVVPVTNEVKQRINELLGVTNEDVKKRIGQLLGLTGADFTPINNAKTVAELRTAVDQVPSASEDVSAAKAPILKAINDLPKPKKKSISELTKLMDQDVMARLGEMLRLTGEGLAPIAEAASIDELRNAVDNVPAGDPDVAAAKTRILTAIDALEREKKEIGQALGSILDVSLDPGQLIPHVEDLKAMVERLTETEAEDRQRVLDAFDGAATIEALKKKVGLLPSGEAQRAVLKAVEDAQAGLERFRQGIETWYDDAMDRVSGVYRRRVRWWLIVIGAVIAILVGADTIQIYRSLSTNPTARAAAVAQAENALVADWCVPTPTLTPTSTPDTEPTPTPTPTPESTPESTPEETATAADGNEGAQRQSFDCLVEALDDTDLGFGYSGRPAWGDTGDLLVWGFMKFVGLVLTTVAVALGAPFWFDVLGKISNLRAAGPRPDKAVTDQTTKGAKDQSTNGTK